MYKSLVLLGLIAVLTGCVSPRQISVFVDGKSTVPAPQTEEFTIAAGDQLQILFSSINAEAIAPYNSAGSKCYVTAEGTVSLPVIGTVTLSGLTLKQAQQLLLEKVAPQVRQALVHISVTNATVTILGEVNAPANIEINQPISLLEAIGQVEGFTHNAKCKDILVQRQENGQLRRYHINLLNDDLCTSPCYYLQKGDVVIVPPLHATSTRSTR